MRMVEFTIIKFFHILTDAFVNLIIQTLKMLQQGYMCLKQRGIWKKNVSDCGMERCCV